MGFSQEKLNELMKKGWSYPLDSSADTVYEVVDETGATMYGVLTEEEVEIDATANDIRLGMTAVTDDGLTVGEKDIPKYHTSEGIQVIPAGSACTIVLYDTDKAEYTKLQAIVCDFNTSLSDSVSTTMVSINGKVYTVQSTDELADVTIDVSKGHILLNVVNENATPCLIRYFTYKED